ncbi:hypothetical protein, partial [Micromonospora sp. ATCC 39149]|uniref:hypothetical protein n=1 Tax=Micromonospora sp. (strain ATCC 39149 / NRRL 15099 / SCC 1413) TaxID=219305 RepID=UPI003510B0E0
MNPVLLPVVAAQGIWLRARTEILPPAGGPTTGATPAPPDVSTGAVDARPLRLGVLGESTAAGCGADTHDEGFTGALARALAERTRPDGRLVGGGPARRHGPPHPVPAAAP